MALECVGMSLEKLNLLLNTSTASQMGYIPHGMKTAIKVLKLTTLMVTDMANASYGIKMAQNAQKLLMTMEK